MDTVDHIDEARNRVSSVPRTSVPKEVPSNEFLIDQLQRIRVVFKSRYPGPYLDLSTNGLSIQILDQAIDNLKD